MSEKTVEVRLQQRQDYRFDIHFEPDMPVLTSDEPAPLGTGQGPSPVQLLAAAVGNCLSDSLLFALRKFHQTPDPLHCTVRAEVGRNAQGRVRVLQMHAQITLGVAAEKLEHLDRVLEQFEAFCTVTQSVGQGIPIHLTVQDITGRQLKPAVQP